MQGIVNNSVYQNYFEYARHAFLKTKKTNFQQLIEKNIFIVLYRSEINYVRSLKAMDYYTAQGLKEQNKGSKDKR